VGTSNTPLPDGAVLPKLTVLPVASPDEPEVPDVPEVPDAPLVLPLCSPSSRADLLEAAGMTVAAEVSVVFEVVEADGCEEAVALPSAKLPPDLRDSAARESEVMSPGPSLITLPSP